MTEGDIDGLVTSLAHTHIRASAEKTPGPAPSKTPGSIPANIHSVDEPTKDDRACDIASLTSSRVAQLSRIDSHEEMAEDIDSLKSQLAQAQEELRQIKNKRLQGLEKGDVLKNKLKQCEDELKQTRLRDSELQKLDGRCSTTPDNIHFERKPQSDLTVKIVFSRTFTFTPKYISRNEISWDQAAIGCLRLDGQLYNAKSGKTREDFGDFINSDHWTSKAQDLAEMIDIKITKEFATHVEPQLMAFYITRTLSESGHSLEDFVKTPIFPVKESGTELKDIIISVSEPICEKCTEFAAAVNEFAKSHGYYFTLENKRKCTMNGYKQGVSDPQPVRFADR